MPQTPCFTVAVAQGAHPFPGALVGPEGFLADDPGGGFARVDPQLVPLGENVLLTEEARMPATPFRRGWKRTGWFAR